MRPAALRLARFMRVGAPVHAVAIAEDGRSLLAGSERDLRLLDRQGRVCYRLADYTRGPGAGERPFSSLACLPDLSGGLAGERAGRLHRLSFAEGPEWGSATTIWYEPNDLYSLALHAGSQSPQARNYAAGMAVIGHLGPALTAVDLSGRPIWRHHPADGTATEGQVWAVAVAGETVYAGCSAGRRYSLLNIEAATGLVRWARGCPRPVTVVAARGALPGVIAVQTYSGRCEVHAYPPDLADLEWSYRPEPGEVVTALGACGALVALGTNTGFILLVDAATGGLLVRLDLLFSSTVLAVALAGRCPPLTVGAQADVLPHAVLAAGLANGQVAYLEHVADHGTPGARMQGVPAAAAHSEAERKAQ